MPPAALRSHRSLSFAARGCRQRGAVRGVVGRPPVAAPRPERPRAPGAGTEPRGCAEQRCRHRDGCGRAAGAANRFAPHRHSSPRQLRGRTGGKTAAPPDLTPYPRPPCGAEGAGLGARFPQRTRPPPDTAEGAAFGAPPHRRHRGDARGVARLRNRRRSVFVRCGFLLSAGSAPRRSAAIPARPSPAVPAPHPRLPTWMVQVYSLSSSSRTVQLYSRSRFLLLPLIHLLSIFPSRAAGRGAGAAGGASVHIPLPRGAALRSRPPPGPPPPHRARCGPSGAEQRGVERSARGRAAAHGGRGGGGPGRARGGAGCGANLGAAPVTGFAANQCGMGGADPPPPPGSPARKEAPRARSGERGGGVEECAAVREPGVGRERLTVGCRAWGWSCRGERLQPGGGGGIIAVP